MNDLTDDVLDVMETFFPNLPVPQSQLSDVMQAILGEAMQQMNAPVSPTAAFYLAELQETVTELSAGELEDIIDHWDDRDDQTQAKIRVLCKRELRKRHVAEKELEDVVRQLESPNYGLF